MPSLFSSKPILHAPHVFTDGGQAGSAYAAFEGQQETPSRQRFQPCQGSAQYKEMLDVIMVLQEIQGPFNLYSDSLYMVNLLPHVPQAHIRLDGNPISTLMVTLKGLLEGQGAPIHVQHLRGHSKLPGFLSVRNNWADRIATSPQALNLQEATQLHDLTHINWRGL